MSFNRVNQIGILTFHDGINHGAYLQAYALHNYLKSKDVENKIIDYKSLPFTLKEYWAFRSKHPFKLCGNISKIIKFKKYHQRFNRTKRVYTQKGVSGLCFDKVIIGSDSVWNYSSPLIGFDPVYFSKNINARKIIAYAASFGPDNSTDAFPKQLHELLMRFDAVAVRDSNTKEFYEKLTHKEAIVVLDPTFLYMWDNDIIEPKYNNYILVYSTGLEPYAVEFVSKLAARLNKKIISIGYMNRECDKNILSVSPFEWLGFIKYADFVVTSMYHGVLFSINFNKCFCTFVTPYRANKITDFLNRMGLSSRIVCSDNGMNILNDRSFDYFAVNHQLALERKRSCEFLQRALNE